MSRTYLQINPSDNLLVALQDLKAGTIINHGGNEIILQDDIAAKHKFTTEAIHKDGNAYMYGVLVGHAIQDIAKGGLIHTFNLHHASQDFIGKQKDYAWTSPDLTKFKEHYPSWNITISLKETINQILDMELSKVNSKKVLSDVAS